MIKDSASPVTAKPHIFVGYDDLSQGYICLDPVTHTFKVHTSVQFHEQWRPTNAIVGSPVSVEDHPLLALVPTVSNVALSSLLASVALPANIDVPCRASQPLSSVSTTAMPLPSMVPVAVRRKSTDSCTDEPNRVSSSTPFLRYTGKVSKRAPYILTRASRVGGHTFDQCVGMTYDKHDKSKVYNESDLKYDIDHRFFEYAAKSVQVKLPARPRVDIDTRRLSYTTVRDQYELAVAGHDGSEPTLHKNMLTVPIEMSRWQLRTRS